jgi:ribosomal protein L11 methyltransferase
VEWQQLIIEPGPPGPDVLEQALFAQGALSVTLLEAADKPILEPLQGTTPLWPEVRVVALFSADASLSRIVPAIEAAIGTSLPASHAENLPDQDWQRAWMKDFKPMKFGDRLWICPGGKKPVGTGGVIVELDPGLAFGTGTHPTTALSLEWLDQCGIDQLNVLDYGCGSGILAIAAMKLGAGSVTAADIDPQALIATENNARRNHIDSGLTICLPENIPKQRFHRLVANILAQPLVELAPRLAELAAPGALIGLSGVLKEQASAVERHYQTWFDMNRSVTMDDWALLSGTRCAA